VCSTSFMTHNFRGRICLISASDRYDTVAVVREGISRLVSLGLIEVHNVYDDLKAQTPPIGLIFA
jgi:hypothetical protein